MGANSKIAWTDHTFNPWRGCTKVSAGCANCYAERQSKRNPGVLGVWGDDGTRVVASEAYWRQPIAWDRAAAKAGERHRVFCASMADVFEDRDELLELRARLVNLIYRTPHLDWLLLTKRPENIDRLWPSRYMPNVWMGVSAEDQQAADERIPELIRVRAELTRVQFLSCEPLLGPVDLTRWVGPWTDCAHYAGGCTRPENPHADTNAPASRPGAVSCCGWGCPFGYVGGIDWVIVGGESGPNARPMHPDWARSLRDQCAAAGVPFFMKQMAGRLPIPADLMIREFPNA